MGSKFYNNYFKDFFKINNIEIYSIYNGGKSVVAEKFIRTLKNKILKHVTAISKNIYFVVLDDIVNKNNNIVHRTIKMKSIDVTFDSYAEYNEESNKKDPKFKVGYHVRISNLRFLWEDIFVVSKIKNTVPWTFEISDLNGQKNYWKFLRKRIAKN